MKWVFAMTGYQTVIPIRPFKSTGSRYRSQANIEKITDCQGNEMVKFRGYDGVLNGDGANSSSFY